MRSNIFSRITWLVVIVAAIGFTVYILEKASEAVPFPSAELASTTEQFEQGTSTQSVPSTQYLVPSTQVGQRITSTSMPASQSFSVLGTRYSVLAIKAPLGVIHAMVASTSEQQSLGLGQRDSLPANDGMLFPFAVPGQYGFWMKDMRFPLDMVWISSDRRVVMVSRDVSPASYPLVIYPPSDISYVLELNADSASKFGIATSTKLVF